ncbi:MAG: hypothetical protein RR420_01260 [Anaerovoracaceae bacterium]
MNTLLIIGIATIWLTIATCMQMQKGIEISSAEQILREEYGLSDLSDVIRRYDNLKNKKSLVGSEVNEFEMIVKYYEYSTERIK